MDAKKCDRCGAFYVPVSAQTDIKTNLQMVASAVNKTKPKHITDICDLCPECVKKFYDWLREDGKNGQNS